jgi:hypothetical protein
VLQGEFDEQEKLVSVLRDVDVVISTVAYPQVLDQLKIIEAIKVAGNIKVYILLLKYNNLENVIYSYVHVWWWDS